MMELILEAAPCGRVKPMHGIKNAPIHWSNFDMFHYLAEAGIPVSRLHDTGGLFGGGIYVDVANLFPHFEADPEDPASYEFPFTDHLLLALCEAGVKPFYRLGCSIEDDATRIAPRRIFPPQDPHKWAVICEHIIRHYNEGWAGGYHMGVEYWEIWNEPDNQPDPLQNPMWRGSREEYYRLYEVAANHLKARFPHLKIGGYASCGFYEILNAEAKEANVSSRTGYFLEFFEGFLAYIKDPRHPAPLDFFSWHSYSGVEENIRYAAYARERLDRYGFCAAESILNEWNPGTHRRGTLADASHIGAMFVAMQHTSTDMMCYYDGQLETSYGGLFDPMTRTPLKAYWVFAAYTRLFKLGTHYPLAGADGGRLAPDLYAMAAGNEAGDRAILLCNTGEAKTVTLPAETGPWELYVLDETRDLASVGSALGGECVIVPSKGVVLCSRLF